MRPPTIITQSVRVPSRITAELRNWFRVADNIFAGNIYGDKNHRFKDGTYVRTCRPLDVREHHDYIIVETYCSKIKTRTGGYIFLLWKDKEKK